MFIVLSIITVTKQNKERKKTRCNLNNHNWGGDDMSTQYSWDGGGGVGGGWGVGRVNKPNHACSRIFKTSHEKKQVVQEREEALDSMV